MRTLQHEWQMFSGQKVTNIKRRLHVVIHDDLMTKLLRQWVEMRRVKHERIKLAEYVNELVRSSLEREEVMHKLFPGMYVVGIVQDVMHISDAGNGTAYRVRRNGNDLTCLEDKVNNCDHVRYVIGIAEVTKLFTEFSVNGITATDYETSREKILKDKPKQVPNTGAQASP